MCALSATTIARTVCQWKAKVKVINNRQLIDCHFKGDLTVIGPKTVTEDYLLHRPSVGRD